MLQRHVADNGVVTYRSPLLDGIGVRHAFSTRLGGVSARPFDSLNLGNPNGMAVQDSVANIEENQSRLLQSAELTNRTLCRVHQVHGNEIVVLRADQPFDNSVKADGLVSDDPARILSVRTADCVPVLLASDDGRVVAAVHAGWRGVVAGIVEVAVRRIAELAPARTIFAAIGPCIGPDAFEVGPEVLEAFAQTFGMMAPARGRLGDKGDVDLSAAVAIQLAIVNVPIDQIDRSDRCTFRDADEFFSHRRDHGLTGRMAAVIGANG